MEVSNGRWIDLAVVVLEDTDGKTCIFTYKLYALLFCFVYTADCENCYYFDNMNILQHQQVLNLIPS